MKDPVQTLVENILSKWSRPSLPPEVKHNRLDIIKEISELDLMTRRYEKEGRTEHPNYKWFS